MTASRTTTPDAAASEWKIDDAVMRLRGWGSDAINILPAPATGGFTVGTDDECALQLEDPSGQVSRVHASLVHDHTRWLLRDLGSKNGLRLDGARRAEIVLEPCVEIGIGGLTLIAESLRSIALRGFLSRLLGWRSERLETIDHALRSIRMAATHRIPMVLCGEGDLVPAARSIHRHTIGADRPFVVCDPRRRQTGATVRSSENYATGMQALVAAHGGTLCVRSRRLPRDFDDVVVALRDPSARVQLVVCAGTPEDCRTRCAAPIILPSLAGRQAELDRIITEYAQDAIAELDAPRTGFLAVDRAWVRENAATSLPEIEKATLRLVAIRHTPNLTQAAARLGMAPVSLSRWIGRRRLPMQVT